VIDDRRVLAVVIGRAGSKGLPGKNAMPIAGRPMICHAIAHALEARCVDRVIVSTDGAAIADAARSMNVEVFGRSAALASDTATVDSAVREAVELSRDDADIIVILYGNVPVRPRGLLDRAVELLARTGGDSVQSYCDVGKVHPYWLSSIDDAGRVRPHVVNTVYRRQDLPPLYVPDGGVIGVTRQSLFNVDPKQPHAFLGRDRRGIVLKAGEVIDVDTRLDALVAEATLAEGVGKSPKAPARCASAPAPSPRTSRRTSSPRSA
jgi:CMP-N,N'-diacetyllegionaminic acid synthase